MGEIGGRPTKMSDIPAYLQRLVAQRASGRCGYSGVSQEGQEARFHIDHVVPVVRGRANIEENLALASVSCSLHKAARQLPSIRKLASRRRFPARIDRWQEHFRWDGMQVLRVDAHRSCDRGGLEDESDLDSGDSP